MSVRCTPSAQQPGTSPVKDETTFALSMLRSACDGCWRKKSKCSGEMPCTRCQRAGMQCTYSTKRKLGRPRGATATGTPSGGSAPSKRKTNKSKVSSSEMLTMKHERVSFTASPATGLGGLAESRFLSTFLEHFAPMFPVADEVSIRDGLMYSFAGMWYGDTDALRGQEARRGRALECALFSSVAIGGLLSGCPPETIAKHVATAQASMVEFRGLSDRHAVSALILHGMMNVLLPLSGSNAEGRKSLDEAQAIFESMPDRDPLLSVILAFRRQVENLSLLKVDTIGCSSSTAGASKGHQPSAASFNSPPSSTSANTEEGEAILKGVEIHHGPNQRTPSQHAHPAYVVADALLLGVRFMPELRTGGGARLRQVHDFVASELNRLVPAKAGAMVLTSLAGTLLGIKTRLKLTDGMLPAAELTSSMLQKCPGWGRSYGRHAAHLSLAVFQMHGQREAYTALKSIVGTSPAEFIPEFDGHKAGGGHLCGLAACTSLAASLLKLKPADEGIEDRSITSDIIPSNGSSKSYSHASSFTSRGIAKRQKSIPSKYKLEQQSAAVTVQTSTPSEAMVQTGKRKEATSRGLTHTPATSLEEKSHKAVAEEMHIISESSPSGAALRPQFSTRVGEEPTYGLVSTSMGFADDIDVSRSLHRSAQPPPEPSRVGNMADSGVNGIDTFSTLPPARFGSGHSLHAMPEVPRALHDTMLRQPGRDNSQRQFGYASGQEAGRPGRWPVLSGLPPPQPSPEAAWRSKEDAPWPRSGAMASKGFASCNTTGGFHGKSTMGRTLDSSMQFVATINPSVNPPPATEKVPGWGGGSGSGSGGGSSASLNGLLPPDLPLCDYSRLPQHQPYIQSSGGAQWKKAAENTRDFGGGGGSGAGAGGGRSPADIARHAPFPSFGAGSDFDFMQALGTLLD